MLEGLVLTSHDWQTAELQRQNAAMSEISGIGRGRDAGLPH